MLYSALGPPEVALGKVVAPEHLPAGDRPPVDVQESRDVTDPLRGWSVPHGADQNDEGAEVNPSTKKTNGRWRGSLSAPVSIAGETESGLVGVGHRVGATARLAGVVGAV